MTSRRDLLRSAACGFGTLALADLMHGASTAGYESPLAVKAPHFAPKAKRVIFLFMQGAPSQWETFDYNPELEKASGGSGVDELLAPKVKFVRYGQSGLPMSELFPSLGAHADSLCLLNGMHTDSPAHPQASIQIHTGSVNFVRPSIGSWTVYGLGTENRDLPGFVTINPPQVGGAAKYGSAFLPASFQGTPVYTKTGTIDNIRNPQMAEGPQRAQLDLVQRMNRDYLDRAKVDPDIDGLIESYELAFRMQTAVPEVLTLKGESKATRAMYGLDNRATQDFGMQCLMARRLAESGVRFIEISTDGWDHHNNLKDRMTANCTAIDKPMGALIADLKQRGLFEDTLIVWGGEFGRSTQAQNDDGRRHNNRGYTMWLAGGGVKGGIRHGACDPVKGEAVEGKVHLHDLHATVLHLLGLDHKRLTHRYAGRDFRLTDVHGNIVNEILS